MTNHLWRHTLVFTLYASVIATGSFALASPPTLPTTPPLGQVVSEMDPRVWSIHQAATGDLWFGSNGAGAYRYDGESLTHYDLDDGLVGLQVRDIKDDRRGGVLVSTNAAVSRFDESSFSPLEVIEGATEVYGWTLDPDDVWLVHQPGAAGPARFDGERLHVLRLPESPAEKDFLANNPDYPRFGMPASGVYSISKDRRGHIWIGTANVGLCRFDGDTISWLYEEHLTTTPPGGAFGIRSIFEDSSGRFWICNTRSRFEIAPQPEQLDAASLLQYTAREGLPSAHDDDSPNFTYFHAVVEAPDGALWFACGSDGVWSFDGERVTKHELRADAYALTLCIDDAGQIWVGTLEHGVFVHRGAGFEPAFSAQSSPD